MNEVGIALAVSLNIILVGALFFFRAETRPVVVTVTFAIMLFVQIRAAAFAILPSEGIGFLQIEPPSADEISYALFLITVGTAALLAGTQLGAILPGVHRARRLQAYSQERWSLPGFSVVGMLVLWSAGIGVGLLVISYISTQEPIPRSVGWLSRFFEMDVALVVTIVWLTLYRPASKLAVWIGIALLVTWLFLSVIGGSRGGAVRMLTILVLSASLLGATKISVRAFLITVCVFLSAAVLTSAGGHIVRLANVTGTSLTGETRDAFATMAHDVTRQDIYRKVAPPSGEVEAGSVFRSRLLSVTEALNPILVRMGNLDYAVLVLNREGDEKIIEKYIRSDYAFRRAANSLVPGKIFADPELSTAQIINVAYRGYSEEHAMSSYFSEPWTIWGLAGVMFGPIGMVLALFCLGFIFQIGFSLISIFPDPVKGVAQVMYLFVGVFGAILMYGIDHTFIPIVHYGIATVSALCVSLAPSFVMNRRSRRCQPVRQAEVSRID